ncbi:MAG: integrase core domain-containing protein [Pirellulales bacterium]
MWSYDFLTERTEDGRLRDELLNWELFLSLPEARLVLDQWRMDGNHRRPHGGLKWLAPAAFLCRWQISR